MAVATTNNYAGAGDGSMKSITWTLTSADGTGDAVSFAEHADITWTVFASAWGTATMKVEGSPDGTSWGTSTPGLSNAAGGAEATITTDKVFTTVERPLFLRPRLTTVGAGATVVVTALLRRAQPLRV